MQVKSVSISELKRATYNPRKRTLKGRNLAGLRASLESIGLIYPIAVTKDMCVIDGHRRLAAAQQLGWTEIPVLIANVENTEQAYAEVNANARYLTGNDVLNIWLKRPSAVTGRMARRFEQAEALLGRKTLVAMGLNGFSVGVINTANRVTGYLGRGDDRQLLARTVRWMIKHRNQNMVRPYMIMQNPPATLYKAIRGDKDLRVRMAVAD